MRMSSELKRRAERRVNILTEIGNLQEDLKALKAEDKADGYNEKALAKCVTEMLRGAEYQEEQLQFELELDTYRTALDLPVTLETAQRHVRESISRENYNAKVAPTVVSAEVAYAESHAPVEKTAKQKSKREKADA